MNEKWAPAQQKLPCRLPRHMPHTNTQDLRSLLDHAAAELAEREEHIHRGRVSWHLWICHVVELLPMVRRVFTGSTSRTLRNSEALGYVRELGIVEEHLGHSNE